MKKSSPDYKTLNYFNEQIFDLSKSDREVAILGGAILEGFLYEFLKDVLVDSNFQKVKGLFDYPKPLSSFGNMLSLAFAFGHLSEEDFRGINSLKKIRNRAAHTMQTGDNDEFSFTDKYFRNCLNDFYPELDMTGFPDEIRDEVVGDVDKLIDNNARAVYRILFNYCVVGILGRKRRTSRITPPLAKIVRE
ncbi:hypothetical protein JO972_10975 [Verrucomicrobiaceae bacterium 5K15]|uniref:Mannitol repressor n=1 Tax=Oceaniferula flava TaxID=2800421 RepID=A0AAE2SBM7_9BACT|nr:hypothetical protein [Oceaniferula flavus]MBK1855483.1 hypothetical protein [Oceaniferula flavus]MBM1136789.1 hypothetical protein [Oceaniferula flavus]